MRINCIFIAASLAFSPAWAGDFALRVAEAKKATATHEGAQYDADLGPFIGAAIQACISPGSTATENLGSFVLVGYVTATGALTSVAVVPQTKVSSCFVEHFGQPALPTPPAAAVGKGFPIVVEVRVSP